MNELAARIAPHLSGIVMHPGDSETEPFPIAPLPIFQNQAMMPPGLAKQEALEAGLPSPDFARIYCEAWLHLVETVGDVTMVDNTELADLRAAAAVRESKRNQMVEFHTPCGQRIRAMARGFDTEHPEVPCELVNHQCGVK
jgi:hypothetical protein